MLRVPIFYISSFFIAMLFQGCHKEEISNIEIIDFESDSTECQDCNGLIGTDGGSISVLDPESRLNYAKLTIPAGALDSSLEFSIVEAEIPEIFFPEEDAIALKLLPEGLVFKIPAILDIPFSELIESQRIVIWNFEESSGSLKEEIIKEVNDSTHTLKCEIDGTSIFYSSENHVNYQIQIEKWHDSIAAQIQLLDLDDLFIASPDKSIAWSICEWNGFNTQAWISSQFQITLMKKNPSSELHDEELKKIERTISSSHSISYEFEGVDFYNYVIYDHLLNDRFVSKEGRLGEGFFTSCNNGYRLLAAEPVIFVFDNYQNYSDDETIYLKINWRFQASGETLPPVFTTNWIETVVGSDKDFTIGQIHEIAADTNYNQIDDNFDRINIEFPEVETLDPKSITDSSVILGGRIIHDGNAPIDPYSCGIKLSPDSDLSNSQVAQEYHLLLVNDQFSGTINELEPGITYYYYAWAVNAWKGGGHGEIKSFTTLTY